MRISSAEPAAITQARAAGKDSEIYERTKQNWPNYWPQFRERNLASKNGIPTGVVPVDIDSKDNPDLVLYPELLLQLPYVLASFYSFGGKGITALCAVNPASYTTFEEYGTAYDSLWLDVLQRTNLMPDASMRNGDRRLVLTSSSIHVNDFFEYFEPKNIARHSGSEEGNALYERFNNDHATDDLFFQVLEQTGWSRTKSGSEKYWCRPGKVGGISAIYGGHGTFKGLFTVLTDNAGMLKKGGYSKARAYRILTFGDANGANGNFFRYLTGKYGQQTAPTVQKWDGSNIGLTQPKSAADDVWGNGLTIDEVIDKLAQSGTEPKIADFKMDYWPTRMQDIAQTMAAATGMKIEYFANAMISAIVTATRGRVGIRVRENYTQSPVLFSISLGRAGIMKSPPHEIMNRSIMKIEHELYKNYEAKLTEYEYLVELPKNEMKNIGAEKPAKPPQADSIIATDGTVEGYIKALRAKGSIGLFYDEIINFFTSMGKYSGNQSSDVAFFLSIFGRTDISRKLSSAQINIKAPFMPISGTGVTSTIIKELKKFKVNGFWERWCYFIVTDETPEVHRSRFDTENQFDISGTLAEWEVFIRNIFNYYDNFSSENSTFKNLIIYDAQALQILERHEQTLIEFRNKALEKKDESLLSLYKKVETIFSRLPIIFWLMRVFENGKIDDFDALPPAEPVDVWAAVELLNYLISTWQYVHFKLFNDDDPAAMIGQELSDFRKNLALKLRAEYPNESYQKITDAVNKMTPGQKPATRSTVHRWITT